MSDLLAIGDRLGTRMRATGVPIAVNEQAAVGALMAMLERFSYGVSSRRIAADDDAVLYYQIDYTLTDVPDDEAYFLSLIHI